MAAEGGGGGKGLVVKQTAVWQEQDGPVRGPVVHQHCLVCLFIHSDESWAAGRIVISLNAERRLAHIERLARWCHASFSLPIKGSEFLEETYISCWDVMPKLKL